MKSQSRLHSGITAKMTALTTITGLSLAALLNPEVSKASSSVEYQSSLSVESTRVIKDIKTAQLTTSQKKTALETKQIKAVLNKAIQTGDMNKALQGSSLSKTTKEALLKLNRQDLDTLKSVQKKLSPLETKGTVVGGYLF